MNHNRPAPDRPGVLVSVSPDYREAAFIQLRQVFPGAKLERVGPDAGVVNEAGISIEDLAEVCRSNRVVFVRHLAQIRSVFAIADVMSLGDAVLDAAEAIISTLPNQGRSQPISLQLWTSGQQPCDSVARPDLMRRHIVSALGGAGWSIQRSASPQTLSILFAEDRAYLGLNSREDGLSDWPGGRVGLARSDERISRSEFKLEELFQTYPLDFPPDATALDLGASPGGWTRIMRRLGARVTAVDPGKLDSRLAEDPGVEWISATVGGYLTRAEARFDVILNDMRMPADLSVDAMLCAGKLLRPKGIFIMTLKLAGSVAPSASVRIVERSLRRLERGFDVLFARQLFHNRHEVTIVGRKRG